MTSPTKRAPEPTWEVTVSMNGESIITIGTNILTGAEMTPEYEAAVRGAARHLLAFLGDTVAAAPEPPAESAFPLPQSLHWLGDREAAVNHWHGDVHPLDIRPVFELPKRPARRERWLTRGDVARLLWSARRTPHLARFIILGFYTGSRSGAILGLKWSWINLDARIMRRKEPGESERRNKRRPDLRIGSRLLAHLRRWKRLDKGMEYVVHYDGNRVIKLRRSWANAAKRAGVEATPHTLRHTRATHLMQAGVSLWEAAGYLGMSTEVLEDVYGKHSPDWQKRAAEV